MDLITELASIINSSNEVAREMLEVFCLILSLCDFRKTTGTLRNAFKIFLTPLKRMAKFLVSVQYLHLCT